jgi:hypothetical protein
MNPNWRIIVLCALAVVSVAFLMRFDNRGRFMLVTPAPDYPPQVIDPSRRDSFGSVP